MRTNTYLREGHHYMIQANGRWQWRLSRRNGYGYVRVAGRVHYAHRVAYTFAKGSIPSDLCVCHSCDNPLCVNPAHLWLGTQADNVGDMVTKARQRSPQGEHNGNAKLTARQVSICRCAARFGVSQRFLAECFKVARSTMAYAIMGRQWKHLPLVAVSC